MKTIITLVTVLVFLFIVYKRKFAPGKKTEKKKAFSAPSGSGTAPEPVPHPEITMGSPVEIRFFAFDYAESDNASSFSTFIDSKVSFSLVWMKDRGYAVRDMKMAVMDKVLVVFIIYGMF